ncbi:MAG: hypothetical protein H6810_10430 [Phycisphaeraceae bacterium]|nr:MAG: hypothetical protein H6810_10430 [Phycisphaeraceae bacterium]
MLACLVLAILPAGCGSSPKSGGDHSQPAPLADAAAVVKAYNARTSRVTSLWARASVVLEGEDAEGRDLRERAEGHLQIVPPSDVALTLGKLGETNLYFGSNDTVYWWFDMIDPDFKVASFGRHRLVTPEKIDRLDLPIDPLDLIEALGITTLPDDGSTKVAPGPEAGTLMLAAPAHRGTRRITIDREHSEPGRIELLDDDGQTLLEADLSRYRLIAGLDPGEAPLRIPERVNVRLAGFDGEIRLSFYEPTRREIKPVAFDPAKLADVYGIDALEDLDMPTERPGP